MNYPSHIVNNTTPLNVVGHTKYITANQLHGLTQFLDQGWYVCTQALAIKETKED